MEPNGTVPKDTWSASQYNTAASFVYSNAYTQPILELLSPSEGESILDMGCGTGELTYRLQEFVGHDGLVVGVDSSLDMLDKARRNGVSNTFCCDIQTLIMPDKFKSLAGTFSAVFTNATLHWCKRDPSGVVRAAKQALKPGGRFVGEFGGYLNCVYGLLYIRFLKIEELSPRKWTRGIFHDQKTTQRYSNPKNSKSNIYHSTRALPHSPAP
ncbi:hypothetical protein ACGC1H_005409 [Rhizoctonia solani]